MVQGNEINIDAGNLEELASLPAQIHDRALAAVVEAAELMVGEAQVRCPVRTGRLRDSIRYEIVEDSNNRVSVRVMAGGPDIPYAAIVEARYPFMQPSFEDVRDQLTDALSTLVGVPR